MGTGCGDPAALLQTAANNPVSKTDIRNKRCIVRSPPGKQTIPCRIFTGMTEQVKRVILMWCVAIIFIIQQLLYFRLYQRGTITRANDV
jgi:hypothetical protein